MNDRTIKELIDVFHEREEHSLWTAFNQLFLFVSAKQYSKNTDIYYLGKVLSYEQLKTLSEYYEGGSIRFPTSDELDDCYTLTVCFFLEKILGWRWSKIKKYFKESNNTELNTVSYGIKTSKLEKEMAKELTILFERVNKNNQDSFLEEVSKNGKKEEK
jgi:hypothetical protein